MPILIICLLIIIMVVDVIISSIKKKKRHKRLISHLQEIQNKTKNNNQMIQNNNYKNDEHQNTYQNPVHNDCLDCDLNKEYYDNNNQIEKSIKNKVKYCKYCGSSTTENIRKCPNCRADLNG